MQPNQIIHSFLADELCIPDYLIPTIAGFYHKEHFPKDEYLVKKGHYCQRMSLIESGYFRFYSMTERKTITHWIFGHRQIVTDVASFFLNEPAKWNIQTLTDTVVYTISQRDHQKLYNIVPQWEKYEKLFIVRLMSALENRVYSLLSMTAEERYQYLFDSDSNMFNELPLHYLASMLGMTPETLSRIRAKSIS